MLESVVLGIVQGALEWLPVSSSAATLLVASNLLDMDYARAYTLSLFLHISTFTAPLLVFARYISSHLRQIIPLITVSTLASIIVGAPLALLFGEFSSSQGGAPLNIVVGLMLLLTSLALRLQTTMRKSRCTDEFSLGAKGFLLVGLVQGLAALPGLSRSALTIAALTALGACPSAAVRASYIMSVPVTAAAGLGTLVMDGAIGGIVSLNEAVVAMVVGLVTGVASIGFMMKIASIVGGRIYLLVLLIGAVSLAWGMLLLFAGG